MYVENTVVHSTNEKQMAKPHGAHDTKQNTETIGGGGDGTRTMFKSNLL